MNPQFPRRSAQEVVTPFGVKVFIKTLNTYQRDEAEKEANYYAAIQCRRWAKGNEGHTAMCDYFNRLGIEQQCEFLADRELMNGGFALEAIQKYPEPVRPERGEQSEADYIAAISKYEEDCKTCEEKRIAFVEKLKADAMKKVRGWSVKYRLAQCVDAYLDSEYAVAFGRRLTLETLMRAVRDAENHQDCYYSNIAAIADLDDEERAFLICKYRELDNMSAAEIPT